MKRKTLNVAGLSATNDDQVQRLVATFRRMVTTVKRHLAENSSQGNGLLSGAQLWALSQVKAAPGLTVQDLAHRLSVHQTTTSNLVEKLESAKCLKRERNKEDKRVVQLFVTPLGNRVLKQAIPTAGGALPEALGRLSKQELGTLEAALTPLFRELNPEQKDDKGSLPNP